MRIVIAYKFKNSPENTWWQKVHEGPGGMGLRKQMAREWLELFNQHDIGQCIVTLDYVSCPEEIRLRRVNSLRLIKGTL